MVLKIMQHITEIFANTLNRLRNFLPTLVGPVHVLVTLDLHLLVGKQSIAKRVRHYQGCTNSRNCIYIYIYIYIYSYTLSTVMVSELVIQ